MSRLPVVRVNRPRDIPALDRSIVDVAVLDMNHSWPNLGHDSMIQRLADIFQEVQPRLQSAGLSFRAISYDVRRSLVIPESPGERFQLYLGTGGPGHIDPRENDGLNEGSQGIRENASWLDPIFDLFDSVHKDENAALISVCHTFGVLCLWSGAARPALRESKSSGIVENELTAEAIAHPWFSRLSRRLPDRKHLRILDSRLFDLVPANNMRNGFIAIGYGGEALTMMEFARDRGGVMPRIFGVNHHPEIVDSPRLRKILDEKLSRNEVSKEWHEERLRALSHDDPSQEAALLLTSEYTHLALIRFHLYRQLRLRGANVHEDEVLEESRSGERS